MKEQEQEGTGSEEASHRHNEAFALCLLDDKGDGL